MEQHRRKTITVPSPPCLDALVGAWLTVRYLFKKPDTEIAFAPKAGASDAKRVLDRCLRQGANVAHLYDLSNDRAVQNVLTDILMGFYALGMSDWDVLLRMFVILDGLDALWRKREPATCCRICGIPLSHGSSQWGDICEGCYNAAWSSSPARNRKAAGPGSV